MDCSLKSPLSMGFSRQEDGVGCHAILQGIFLTRNLTHVSHASCIGRWVFYYLWHLGSPNQDLCSQKIKRKKKRNNSSHIILYLKISDASSVFKNQSLNSILSTLSPEPVFLNVPYAPLQLKCLLCLINISYFSISDIIIF